MLKTTEEKMMDLIFTAVPVEHFTVDSIDRLGDFLLVCISFLQFGDYQTLAITQYRYDRKDWSMGESGVMGPYLVVFNINISTKNIEVFYQEKHYFNEIPGIGLEVSCLPLSQDKYFYPVLFSKRTDEVYMTRQESECEPLGGLWRLKCGKSWQERQRGTTDLLLLRKEKINNVKAKIRKSQ